jgi:hypothetical protein
VSSCCGGGGGIFSNGDGKVSITTRSHVDRNTVSMTNPVADSGKCCHGGGGVYQNATANVLVSNSTVSGNAVTVTGGDGFHGGGGVYVDPAGAASADLFRATMDSNAVHVTGPAGNSGHCCSGGGAVYSFDGASVRASTLTRNSAQVTAGDYGHGGGAINIRPSISGHFPAIPITTSTLARNTTTVTGAGCCNGGGAVQYNATNGPLTFTASLIAGNRATISGSSLSGGGGVYEDSLFHNGYVNTTITGNSTNAANPQQGGGGIYLLNGDTARTTFANVTLASNSAPAGSGGGVLSDGSVLRTANSIVALNSAATGPNCSGFASVSAVQPVFTSLGHNLTSGAPSCGFNAPSDRVVTPAAVRLAPLKANGGPTQTRALLAGSPAIDGGPAAGCKNLAGQPLTVDQRGLKRPLDGNGDLAAICDIGAFEARARRARCTLRRLSARVGRTKRARFRLRAGCDERITGRMIGKATIKPRRKKARVVKLRPVRVSLRRNAARTVRVRVPRAVRRALARHAHVSARFTLTGANANGAARATARIATVRLAKH